MYRSSHRKYSMKRAIIVFCLVGLITAGTVVWWTRHYYQQNLQPISANQGSRSVIIPKGYNLKQTAKLLKTQQLIRNSAVFEQYVRGVDASDKIKAGTYDLSPSYSVPQIVSIITEGKVKTNLVTILPGQTLKGIESALLNAGFDKSAVDRALNPAIYDSHPALVDKPREASLEGYLYPESFQKTAETKPEEIIGRALDEMQKRLTPDTRAKIAKQGLGIYDAIKLASIVEKEVSHPEDRAQVAQVFLRRIREGIRLESDATTSYIALGSSTKNPSYNTYQNDGLMPSPISNVSESSLMAVANPASTNWLFFVSGDDGITYFSTNKADHEANIAAHCKKLCSQ